MHALPTPPSRCPLLPCCCRAASAALLTPPLHCRCQHRAADTVAVLLAAAALLPPPPHCPHRVPCPVLLPPLTSDWRVPQSHLRRGRGPAARASHPSATPRPMLALPCGGRCPGVVYHCRDAGLECRDTSLAWASWDVTPHKRALIAIRANCNRM